MKNQSFNILFIMRSTRIKKNGLASIYARITKWSAQALNLNPSLNYNAIQLNQIKSRSAQSASQGMGAIMTYDLRLASQRDPLNALKKIAEGAFGGTVTRASSPASGYAKDWATGGLGTTITYADVQ